MTWAQARCKRFEPKARSVRAVGSKSSHLACGPSIFPVRLAKARRVEEAFPRLAGFYVSLRRGIPFPFWRTRP